MVYRKRHGGTHLFDKIAIGNSSLAKVFSVADTKVVELRVNFTATSGDNRVIYARGIYTGVNSTGGDCLRAVAALAGANGTVRGAQISLEATAAGYITGLGVGCDAQLYVQGILPSGGTYYAGQSEMYFDASATVAAVTKHAIHSFAANGDATAVATCLNLWSITGAADSGGGEMISPGTSMGTVTGTVRVLINGDVRYMPYYSHEGHA